MEQDKKRVTEEAPKSQQLSHSKVKDPRGFINKDNAHSDEGINAANQKTCCEKLQSKHTALSLDGVYCDPNLGRTSPAVPIGDLCHNL